jgi:hypothetical protein
VTLAHRLPLLTSLNVFRASIDHIAVQSLAHGLPLLQSLTLEEVNVMASMDVKQLHNGMLFRSLTSLSISWIESMFPQSLIVAVIRHCWRNLRALRLHIEARHNGESTTNLDELISVIPAVIDCHLEVGWSENLSYSPNRTAADYDAMAGALAKLPTTIERLELRDEILAANGALLHIAHLTATTSLCVAFPRFADFGINVAEMAPLSCLPLKHLSVELGVSSLEGIATLWPNLQSLNLNFEDGDGNSGVLVPFSHPRISSVAVAPVDEIDIAHIRSFVDPLSFPSLRRLRCDFSLYEDQFNAAVRNDEIDYQEELAPFVARGGSLMARGFERYASERRLILSPHRSRTS